MDSNFRILDSNRVSAADLADLAMCGDQSNFYISVM
jgi:hypothetical protein